MAKPEKKEIVLNRMFTGDYLESQNNIGHEIINLYTTDAGEHYVYLLARGTYKTKAHQNIESVILVRKEEKLPLLEVWGYATDLLPIAFDKETQLAGASKAKYAGVPMTEIFKGGQQQDVFVTFKAGTVKLEHRKIFIGFDKKVGIQKADRVIYLTSIELANQTLKQYVTDDTNDFIELKELVDDGCKCGSVPQKVTAQAVNALNQIRPTFFDICGIANRELSFSRGLRYFIEKYPELLSGFAKSRGCTVDVSGLTAQCEWENIDIFVTTDTHVIVIENKILSGINGVQTDEDNNKTTQLDKYYEKIIGAYQKKKCIFVLLVPDYSNVVPTDSQASNYITIKYSEIRDFLNSVIGKEPYASDFYLREYLLGIQKHCDAHYMDRQKIMDRKFQEAIRRSI